MGLAVLKFNRNFAADKFFNLKLKITMINSSLYLSMILAVGVSVSANAQLPAEADAKSAISHLFRLNHSELRTESNNALFYSFSRTKQNEADKSVDSRIPEVMPGKKMVPAGYACRLDSVVRVDNTGAFFEKDILEYTEEGLPKHRMTQK